MERPTRIVNELLPADGRAADGWIQAVYEELRALARRYLAHDRAGRDMQPTSLIHEAYLRLVRSGRNDWADADQFFAAAAEAMRRILIDHARKQQALKRGGGAEALTLQETDLACHLRVDELLALDEALTRFEEHSPERARLVKLRCFVGLELKEAAEMMKVSRATATRYWRYARAWLFKAMEGGGAARPGEPPTSDGT